MAVTIASAQPCRADETGHGNQSHLIYAVNQQRWWLFNLNGGGVGTKVNCFVASSNDLTTATWSAGTDSPVFPSSQSLDGNDQRNLACLGFANGGTDVVHVSVGMGASGAAGVCDHIRATFTGASSITWESWADSGDATATSWDAVKGNALGIGTDGYIYQSATTINTGQTAYVQKSSNADTGATWTSGFGASSPLEVTANPVNAYAFAALAAGDKLELYENGDAASPNDLGLTYIFSGGQDRIGVGTSSQDDNDWCLCRVDDTHIYAFRRSGSNTFLWQVFDGAAFTTPSNGVPNQNHKAGSGLFAVSNGTDLYLFLLDSAGNQAVKYVKCSAANGATPTWGSWTQLDAAGSAARNYISGCPVFGNNQIGVIFTEVNGLGFDIKVAAFTVPATPVVTPRAIIARESAPWEMWGYEPPF